MSNTVIYDGEQLNLFDTWMIRISLILAQKGGLIFPNKIRSQYICWIVDSHALNQDGQKL
jgi:hypothetical protein